MTKDEIKNWLEYTFGITNSARKYANDISDRKLKELILVYCDKVDEMATHIGRLETEVIEAKERESKLLSIIENLSHNEVVPR